MANFKGKSRSVSNERCWRNNIKFDKITSESPYSMLYYCNIESLWMGVRGKRKIIINSKEWENMMVIIRMLPK